MLQQTAVVSLLFSAEVSEGQREESTHKERRGEVGELGRVGRCIIIFTD
jgi:hypothetical protein